MPKDDDEDEDSRKVAEEGWNLSPKGNSTLPTKFAGALNWGRWASQWIAIVISLFVRKKVRTKTTIDCADLKYIYIHIYWCKWQRRRFTQWILLVYMLAQLVGRTFIIMTTNCIDQSRVGSNDYISQSRQEEWVEVEVSGGEEKVAGKQVNVDWRRMYIKPQ